MVPITSTFVITRDNVYVRLDLGNKTLINHNLPVSRIVFFAPFLSRECLRRANLLRLLPSHMHAQCRMCFNCIDKYDGMVYVWLFDAFRVNGHTWRSPFTSELHLARGRTDARYIIRIDIFTWDAWFIWCQFYYWILIRLVRCGISIRLIWCNKRIGFCLYENASLCYAKTYNKLNRRIQYFIKS